jgi:iron(II)-dependent oxidoreductase
MNSASVKTVGRHGVSLLLLIAAAACSRSVGRAITDTSNSADAAMALIPGSSFQMGTDSASLAILVARYPDFPPDFFLQETPAHEVQLRPFYLDRTEVTVAAFALFVRTHPEWSRARIPPTATNGKYLSSWTGDQPPTASDSLPVNFITWYAATAYCASVGKRLPTEAEWEFAALGGQHGDVFPWGTTPPTARDANWDESGIHAPVAVGHYAANAYGLYDLAGNVWEYVSDRWRDHYSDPDTFAIVSPDSILALRPSALESARGRHVIRGGSFDGGVLNLRVRYRDSHPVDGAQPHVGFRCARTPTS